MPVAAVADTVITSSGDCRTGLTRLAFVNGAYVEDAVADFRYPCPTTYAVVAI